MKFVLKGNNRKIMTTLPNTETEISRICKELNIINDVHATVTVDSVMDPKMNHLLQEKEIKLDELPFFMKLFDSLGEKNKDTFYAVADGMKYGTAHEFINLTFNTHCYSLVDDFKDLNTLGKNLYLNEKVATSLQDMSAVDGIQYVRELMSQDQNPIPSIYGDVYPNKNVPEEIYQGQVYPKYHYNDTPISVCLQAENNRDFLYLPCTNCEVL